MSRKVLSPFVVILLLSLPTAAGEKRNDADLARQLREQVFTATTAVDAASDDTVYPNTPCFAGEIKCGETKTGRVSVDSCEANDIYAVGYLFKGTQGQKVTITGRSPEFAATVILGDGRAGQNAIYAQHDVFVDGATARISDFPLPYTGDYFVIITPLEEVEFGDYVLTLTCTSAPPPTNCSPVCTPNANTACMLNDRFRVTMTWNDPGASLSGNGRIITYADARPVTDPVNGEISESTFWSMYSHDPNSLEALVRMIRGNNSFWVFVTGFASAEYTVTVQDTRTCATWQRTTPFGSKEKITDFNAFPFP